MLVQVQHALQTIFDFDHGGNTSIIIEPLWRALMMACEECLKPAVVV